MWDQIGVILGVRPTYAGAAKNAMRTSAETKTFKRQGKPNREGAFRQCEVSGTE